MGEVGGRDTTQSFPDTGRSGAPRGGFADFDATQVLGEGSRPLPDGREAGLRDPWEAAGETAAQPHDPGDQPHDPGDQTHDPHEVTVQLDAVGLQQDLRLRKAEGEPGGGSHGSDAPVFVDASGRRSRTFRRLGIAIGIACAVYAVVIVVTLLSGSSDAPWLPVPGQKDDKPAGQVEPTSLPADSVQPSGTGSLAPGSTPTAGDGTTPSPGASGTAAGSSGGPAGPGTSNDPDPTPTKSASNSGPVVGNPDPSTPADPPTSSSPDPDPSPSASTPDVSESAVGPGTGTVADGPSSPSPVTEDPGTPAASSAPSPEYTL